VKLPTDLFAAVTIGAAVILLSGCSSVTQSGVAGLPAADGATQFRQEAGRPQLIGILSSLLVDDESKNAVEVFRDRTWSNLGAITKGIDLPFGNWVDRNGSLYVANVRSHEITEYDSDGKLIFRYSTRDASPSDVTTDGSGNVYAAATESASSEYTGYVIEYGQGSNDILEACRLSGQVVGVARDKRGDVFATYIEYSDHGPSKVVEYPRGLIDSGCNGTVLPIAFDTADGIAVDREENLVVCDEGAPAVDIIAPPYTKVTGTLGSGWAGPMFVTINRTGTQAYVVDAESQVRILTYPNGSNVATLGSANGLVSPVSAVDTKNYVP
jgi:DNA-binding beta-propeller fold protein YncE